MTVAEKQAIIAQYAIHEGDTGSPEVQIAIPTYRINALDRASEIQHEGSPQPPGTSEDGRTSAQPPRLPPAGGHRAVPRHHRQAEPEKVIAEGVRSGSCRPALPCVFLRQCRRGFRCALRDCQEGSPHGIPRLAPVLSVLFPRSAPD